MPLDKVPAHARRRGDGALEVHAGSREQAAEVRAAEGFGRDADFEGGGGEGGDGEAGAVDADAVAEVGVGEEGGAVHDCEGGAAAAAEGVVLWVEGGDGCGGGGGFG